jgi:serine/threonine protein kinase
MGFEKTLVVKCILPNLVEDPQFIEMFLSEAKLAAQLTHPNIVQIFDFCTVVPTSRAESSSSLSAISSAAYVSPFFLFSIIEPWLTSRV